MKTYLLIFTMLGKLLLASSQTDSDPKELVNKLEVQSRLIKNIEIYCDQSDRGRLLILKQASDQLVLAINDPNIGAVHAETFRRVHNHILKYHYSKAFLNSIRTEYTNAQMDTVIEIAKYVSDTFGFNESPLVTITKSTFEQMHKLLLQLLELEMPQTLRKKLEDLKVDFGKIIAIAALGDGIKTLQAAKPVCFELRVLYPELVKIATNNPALNYLLEFQGLNEFYMDYAQLN